MTAPSILEDLVDPWLGDTEFAREPGDAPPLPVQVEDFLVPVGLGWRLERHRMVIPVIEQAQEQIHSRF